MPPERLTGILLTLEDFLEIQASMRIEGFDISNERVRAFYDDYIREIGVQDESPESYQH